MRYRKKPVVIEAYRWHPDNEPSSMPAWLIALVGLQPERFDTNTGCLAIPTLEGTMTANPGNWIIKGVKGELYPCKPDIFAATYEPADSGSNEP